MHADICDPDDKESVERFRAVLTELGAEKLDQSWGLGVDLFNLQIGGDTLTVFSDAWSIDIEGPDHLVNQVLSLLNQSKAKHD